MFTRKEESMMHTSYFRVVDETDQAIELQSVCTDHCWSILKNAFESRPQIILYHKKNPSDKHYHRRKTCKSVAEAVDVIRKLDEQTLSQRSAVKDAPGAQTRQLKVYRSSTENYKQIPSIRIAGKWLEQYGFDIGDTYNVICESGKLVLTKVI